MCKKVIFCCVFLLQFLYGPSQNVEFVNKYLKTADSIKCFSVDAFNSFYFYDINNVYTKINTENNKVFNFKSDFKQEDFCFDVINPFKTLVFNANENKIFFLDKTFSVISEFDFEDIDELSDELFVINSSENKIWIYDKQQNKLYKYYYISKKLIETEDLKWFCDEGFNPLSFQEVGKNVLLQSEDFKLIIFDVFGKKQKIYNIFDEKVISLYHQKIYFWDKNKNISFYDIIKNEKVETKFKIPDNSIIFMNNQQVFYINEKKIFQLNLDSIEF